MANRFGQKRFLFPRAVRECERLVRIWSRLWKRAEILGCEVDVGSLDRRRSQIGNTWHDGRQYRLDMPGVNRVTSTAYVKGKGSPWTRIDIAVCEFAAVSQLSELSRMRLTDMD